MNTKGYLDEELQAAVFYPAELRPVLARQVSKVRVASERRVARQGEHVARVRLLLGEPRRRDGRAAAPRARRALGAKHQRGGGEAGDAIEGACLGEMRTVQVAPAKTGCGG